MKTRSLFTFALLYSLFGQSLCADTSLLVQGVNMQSKKDIEQNNKEIAEASRWFLTDGLQFLTKEPTATVGVLLGVAGLYGGYRAQDSIKKFITEHPYITGSLVCATAGSACIYFFGLPAVLAVGKQTACVILQGPLLAAQWMQGVMAIKYGYDLVTAKNFESKKTSENFDKNKTLEGKYLAFCKS